MENLVYIKQLLARVVQAEGSLVDALRRLDEFANDRQLALDPKLRHYLQRRSYQKAWDLLLKAE